jgi:hypothetical protein
MWLSDRAGTALAECDRDRSLSCPARSSSCCEDEALFTEDDGIDRLHLPYVIGAQVRVVTADATSTDELAARDFVAITGHALGEASEDIVAGGVVVSTLEVSVVDERAFAAFEIALP